MKRLFFPLLGIALMLIPSLFVSCSETDEDPPVAQIFFEPDANNPYKILFSVVASNAESYQWNFGDQKGSSMEKDPQYTYEMSGDYTVSLMVKGKGGEIEVNRQVSIAASTLELLTGGAAASNGKTWVLSKTASNGDGASSFAGIQYQPAPNEVLSMFGIGDEYDNEFTFHNNGNYGINAKNGNVLAAAVYAYMENTLASEPAWDLGLAAAKYTAGSGLKFELKEGDLSVVVREENPQTQVVSEVRNHKFTNVKYITFTNGYLGILTYNTTVIIRDISSSRMVVSMLVSTLDPSKFGDDFQKPSIMYTLSFDKK